MIQSVPLEEYSLFHQKYSLILKEPEIRFAGFLDVMGNLIAGSFRDTVIPLHDESERKKMYLEAVMSIKNTSDFDYELGSVEYVATRRKKITTITFDLGNHILFVSAESNTNIEKTAQKIIQICGV